MNQVYYRNDQDQRFLGLIPFALGVAAAPLFYRPKCCPPQYPYYPPYPTPYGAGGGGGSYSYNYQYGGYNTGLRSDEVVTEDANDEERHKNNNCKNCNKHNHGHNHGHNQGHHHKPHHGHYTPYYWYIKKDIEITLYLYIILLLTIY